MKYGLNDIILKAKCNSLHQVRLWQKLLQDFQNRCRLGGMCAKLQLGLILSWFGYLFGYTLQGPLPVVGLQGRMRPFLFWSNRSKASRNGQCDLLGQ